MIFKISFLTLALALSSLLAVTAMLVPKNGDGGGDSDSNVSVGPGKVSVYQGGAMMYVRRFVEI